MLLIFPILPNYLNDAGKLRPNQTKQRLRDLGEERKRRYSCASRTGKEGLCSGVQMKDQRKQTEKEAPAFEAMNIYGDLVLIKVIRTKKVGEKKKGTKSFYMSLNDS